MHLAHIPGLVYSIYHSGELYSMITTSKAIYVIHLSKLPMLPTIVTIGRYIYHAARKFGHKCLDEDKCNKDKVPTYS